MRHTAERALADAAAPSASSAPKIFFLGNSPAAHWERPDGSKVFVHRAQLIKGSWASAPGYADFAWLTKEEVVEKHADAGQIADMLRKLL